MQRLLGRRALLSLRAADSSDGRLPVAAARAALGNLFDLTVADALRNVAAAQPDAALAEVLRDVEVRAAALRLGEDSEMAGLYQRAVARHG